MNLDDAQKLAESLVRTGKMGTWSVAALTTWLRSECKCVYCGRDMLENRDVAYFFSSIEHLLPKAKFPELESEPSNQVLTCRSCNAGKGQSDLNDGGPHLHDAASGRSIEDKTRQVLISRVRGRLKNRRKKDDAQFNVEKRMINEALESSENPSS